MVNCPKCGQRAMSAWDRLNHGPLATVKQCASCEAKLRGSWWDPLVVVLGAAGFGNVALQMPSIQLKIGVSIVIIALTLRAILAVPLVEVRQVPSHGDA